MNPEQSKRALEILDDAHGLNAYELETYLNRVCGENSLLRREVLSYLGFNGEETVLPAATDSSTVPEIPHAGVSETRYDLGDEIARGGMGIVLRAFDNNIRRDVAVKILPSKWEDNADVVRRFLQEAQISGQLQHPGIAPVYEIGRLPDGRFFIAMKLVKGTTLENLLSHRHDPGDDQAKFLSIFEQVCQAIAFAHRRGVIHRDLKPSNVMVGEFGEVQVMDWGVAKLISETQLTGADGEDPSEAETRVSDPIHVDTDDLGTSTRVGQLVGTPAYMAPEQSIGRADKTADVYSLGAMLYEILTGHKSIEDADGVTDQLDQCGCERALAQLAKDCLQRNEADRPQDADVVAAQISAHTKAMESRLKEAEIATARAEVKAEEERKRRHRTLWTIAAVAILLVIASLVGMLVRNAAIQRGRAARADGLVDQLLIADIQQVPTLLKKIEPHRNQIAERLSTEFEEAKPGSIVRLHSALALPTSDGRRLEYLQNHLLRATPNQFSVVHAALLPQKDQVSGYLWQCAEDDEDDTTKRFRAAAALAEYEPNDERWGNLSPFVAEHLTDADVYMFLGQWVQQLRPARRHLGQPLARILADRSRSGRQREVAAVALADYWHDEPERLAELILVADEAPEFAPLIAALRSRRSAVERPLTEEMHAIMPDQSSRPQREDRWKRQSLAAVTLVHLGYGDRVWPLLRLTPDPSLRSFIIDNLARLQADHNTLAAQLAVDSDASIRRALIQSLGSLNQKLIPSGDRSRVAEQLQSLYANDPDPGVHSSAAWTLRQWGQTLPRLPIAAPVVSDNHQQRLADLALARRAVWDRHMQEQPLELPVSLQQGLVAHYPLDHTEAARASEANGGPSGTYRGPNPPRWAPGVVDQALQLEGDGGYIQCGNGFSPERTDEFSYGCWFYANSDRAQMCLLEKMGVFAEGTGRVGFNIQIKPDKLIAVWTHEFPENRLALTANVESLLGHWHHVFVTYDASATAAGVRVYVDGRRVPFQVWTDNLTGSILNTGTLRIGSEQKSWSFRGGIDDLRIYDRQLTEDEILALYQSGISALTRIPEEMRTAEQQSLLTSAYQNAAHAPQQGDLPSKLVAAEKALLDQWESMRRWYVNSQGQTMMVIANIPTSDANGNDAKGTKDEKGIDYDFAIAGHEVTVAQFRRFQEEHEVDDSVAPTENCPVHDVTWDMAAEYCNWLSDQEGIPEDQWVYRSKPGPAGGMLIKDNYLDLRGYRLPTSAEWEHACRAGTEGTSRFNVPRLLLPRYGHFESLSSTSVGSLLPNDLGLFDTYGNVWEICHNKLESGRPRLRGESYKTTKRMPGLSSQIIVNLNDAFRHSIGFRVARTHR